MDCPMSESQEIAEPSAGTLPTGAAPAAWPMAARLARQRLHELLAPLSGGRLQLGDALGTRRFGTST
ncbi:MAG: hypothetical protein DYH20_09000, partial [Gammaproteobacteria bacterium PRO9]|nr:hypothetical protein [Gammaproteobacteria bacterium PRO9]